MTDSEITTLAREYAEELSPDNKINREMIELDCLGFLDRVLNSYCLVEKSNALTAYNALSDYGKNKGVECASCANYTARVWMKRLFPEIAKEVEG